MTSEEILACIVLMYPNSEISCNKKYYSEEIFRAIWINSSDRPLYCIFEWNKKLHKSSFHFTKNKNFELFDYSLDESSFYHTWDEIIHELYLRVM